MGELPENRPAHSAAGTLAKTPLAHLLVYTHERRLTGTLEIAAVPPAMVTASIFIIGGRPAKVRTSEPGHYLGGVLHELGSITEEQLTRSLADLARAKATGPALHGQLLVSQRIIGNSQLEAALCEQIGRKLRHVASMPLSCAYAYFDGFDGLQGWGVDGHLGFDLLPMLWPIVHENPPWAHVDEGLAGIAASAMRLGRGADLGRLGLGKDQRAAAELLRVRPMPVAEFVSTSGLSDRQGQLLAYTLLLTKQVDVLRPQPKAPPSVPPSTRPPRSSVPPRSPLPPRQQPSPPPAAPSLSPPAPVAAPVTVPPASRLSRPPTTTPSPIPAARTSPVPAGPAIASPSPTSFSPPPLGMPAGLRKNSGARLRPPEGLAPELAERWDEIIDRAATIDRADYFMMLDISQEAKREEVEAAFFTLVKQWHPDRLPAELAPVKDACSRVFSRMSEAHATLVDAERRARYMRLLADGSGSPEMQETVARVVEAATAFQKAEVCFKRGDHVQAEEFCRKAVEADATQPDYHAMLAWLTALKPDYQSPEKTLECIRMLDKALEMSDKCEKAYYWRGCLHKRIGRASHAVRDFRRAADLNPRNIDAAREVRLFHLRGGRTSSKPPVQPAGTKQSPLPPRPDEAPKPGLLNRLFKKT
ncbi:MAG TPA: DnaJ domain-containing protein [Polyangiaceae bacterium]|nr:DnaJ domain-containing protein [Polyangiaceae bacterium]